ncbi:MAG: metallophosphoesterase [Saprospiraceae bacterium]|nr:metallophosphoesterase [Saprospiraceae bacterium]
MKIALITDLHIGKPEEDTFHVDVRQNFLHILQQVQQYQPEHLIINGDLSYMVGNLDTYLWMKSHLDALAIPYDMITGNHDDAGLLAEAFDRQADYHNGYLFYKRQLQDWNCLFLDTAPKMLSPTQLLWLEEQMNSSRGKNVMIFMHHPPVQVGAPFMDIHHSLLNQAEVQAILATYDKVIPVFCGHYHTEKTIAFQNLIVQITPSCFFQIDPYSVDFQIDDYRIAYRQIDIAPDSWRSTVRYFKGHPLPKQEQTC